MIDVLHNEGIGVLIDWVPAHFPKDDWALAHFDGTPLYEHADPRKGEHPDWGTLIFNYGRNEVRIFSIANALFWIEELHVDGLRVDAVASMLYLDYSRKEGEWIPNAFGGRENIEAIEFLKELSTIVGKECPGAITAAEESTSWPGVSRPVHTGGLGFDFKWNMGWMHDTLEYFTKNPVYRRFHHNQLTFSLWYAFLGELHPPDQSRRGRPREGFAHRQDAGRSVAVPGQPARVFAYMWAHPGKQLIFMGSEFAQSREWNHDQSLDWHLLDFEEHQGIQRLVRDLNDVYKSLPELWEKDSSPEGFRWIDPNDADNNVLTFFRTGESSEHHLVCACNFSPVPHENYRMGLPGLANTKRCSTPMPACTEGPTTETWVGLPPSRCHGTGSTTPRS